MISYGESKDQIKYMIMTKALTSTITELTLNLNYKFLRDVNYVESITVITTTLSSALNIKFLLCNKIFYLQRSYGHIIFYFSLTFDEFSCSQLF